ncbi:MAG: hypothetical protein IJC16_02900 [Rikenellaceae bacterium]|nr:hypothetical protein [Rikenellaceae bacterium]
MIRKRIGVVIVCCMLNVSAARAQETVCVFRSADSLAGRECEAWDDVGARLIEYEGCGSRYGNQYRFTGRQSEHRRLLRGVVPAVEFRDSLYVSGSIFGMKTTYLYAERLGDRLLVVSSRPIQNVWEETNEVEWLGETFRVIGGMVPWIVASFDGWYRYYFCVDLTGREIRALNNRGQMVRLLAPYPDLVTRYRLEGGLQTSRAVAPFIDEYLRRERGRR